MLVNNAGITQPLKLMDIKPENYEAVADVSRARFPLHVAGGGAAIRERKSGSIISLHLLNLSKRYRAAGTPFSSATLSFGARVSGLFNKDSKRPSGAGSPVRRRWRRMQALTQMYQRTFAKAAMSARVPLPMPLTVVAQQAALGEAGARHGIQQTRSNGGGLLMSRDPCRCPGPVRRRIRTGGRILSNQRS